MDIGAQRFERGDIDDADFVRQRAAKTFFEEIIERGEKRSQRFAGSGRRGDESVPPFADGRPSLPLRGGRLAEGL